MAKAKTILTVWEIRTNDVWGNPRDGWEVNDSYVADRAYELAIPVTAYNQGTPQEFEAASPTTAQIHSLWGRTASIDNGCSDDLHLYIVSGASEKPVGDMFCVSHESLSPIREIPRPAEAAETQP
ncbi:MAG: hypothetical protein EHM35_00735 [Planctomycetaceae bacterium]|nr:MAG: hypothetical protein EHM35_00735 [Planctomycetaceae bacterium]